MISKTINSKIYFLFFCIGVKLGCFILKEENRLRVFRYRVLSKTFEPKTEWVRGKWRKI
jgi:hypothetical protein